MALTSKRNRIVSWVVGLVRPVPGSIRMEFDCPTEYECFIKRGVLKIRHKES